MTGEAEPRRSPLHEWHRSAGARMGSFGGWEMPLRYQDGSVREHLMTRDVVGLFDVSHLGMIQVRQADAFAALNGLFTNDLGRIRPGHAQYTLLVNEEGGVVDDIIVWWVSEECFWVLPNAANLGRVRSALQEFLPPDAVRDQSGQMGLLALQGPAWREVLVASDITTLHPERFEVVQGEDLILAGTGYTGEPGCEILVAGADVSGIWNALVETARSYGGGPAGLVARDTLRLEMGYPLYGQEMDESTSPWESGLGWVVALGKGDFHGRDALEERKKAPRWSLVGLEMLGREIPRHGCQVQVEGVTRGVVTSGNMSPVLKHGIALARVETGQLSPGMAAEIDIRGRQARAVCVNPPFVDR